MTAVMTKSITTTTAALLANHCDVVRGVLQCTVGSFIHFSMLLYVVCVYVDCPTSNEVFEVSDGG